MASEGTGGQCPGRGRGGQVEGKAWAWEPGESISNLILLLPCWVSSGGLFLSFKKFIHLQNWHMRRACSRRLLQMLGLMIVKIVGRELTHHLELGGGEMAEVILMSKAHMPARLPHTVPGGHT